MKGDDRPDLTLVGMASLLPRATRLEDQTLADSLRLHLAAWRGSAAALNTVCEHQDRVVAVALSTNGKTALTGSFDDKTARLWETTAGKPIGLPL